MSLSANNFFINMWLDQKWGVTPIESTAPPHSFFLSLSEFKLKPSKTHVKIVIAVLLGVYVLCVALISSRHTGQSQEIVPL